MTGLTLIYSDWWDTRGWWDFLGRKWRGVEGSDEGEHR